MNRPGWVIACLLASASASAADPPRPAGPLAPAEAHATFELEPGLAVELVAAEPLVVSPCAVAWDERGRMYVAENRGYPTGGPNGEPVGRIALLEDTDADGLPDRRTDFATGLSFPNGVMPWRGGLIVTCAPDVLYLKDTDGDGKADTRDVLLTSFATTGSTQLRVNDPTLGPDGWVYLAGGLSGGVVHSPKNPDKKFDLARNDCKFRPDTGEIELTDGKGQFGLAFDDAGHYFTCYNRVQVQHAPLPARYLARNPRVTPPGVLHNCPELLANMLLGGGADAAARIYPISANVTTADSHAGTYSAACGVHIARGDALPPPYLGAAWSCDPTANLVRCDELIPTGGTFGAKRMFDGTEALRSRDDWFRPVFLADGPDGALYVCDMYRRTIEHPDYLPEEVRKRTDFTRGKDMGRIWRIMRSVASRPDLADGAKRSVAAVASTTREDLISALGSANGWVRDTAFRRLTESGGKAHAAALARLGSAAKSRAAAAAAALNLLANPGALRDETLADALKHPAPLVRENAVRLSESRLAKTPELAKRVITLTDDEHVHVRYAAVRAAGEIGPDGPVIDALARAARRDAEDKWFRAAILTSATTAPARLALLAALARDPGTHDAGLVLVRDLAQVAAADGGSGTDVPPDATREARAAVIVGLAAHDASKWHEAFGAGAAGGQARDASLWAREVASSRQASPTRRALAVSLLALTRDMESEAVLLRLTAPDESADVAAAAVRALAHPRRASAATRLLEPGRWQRYTPNLRATVIASVAGRPEFAGALLDAIEAGVVPASALSTAQREQLKASADAKVKERAAALFANTAAAGDRQKAFEEARAVLQLTGVPANGKRMFMNHCASCHRLDKEGFNVGPDLFGIRNQPKESILLHVVIPDQEVAPNFTAYDCVTTDGRSLTGLVTADTPSSVTLRQVLGLEETLRRDQIQSLTVSKVSLMPPGLEKLMTKQELADLLAYLRGE